MITIIGGTYHETCLEPHFQETYGSGLRACKVILSLDSTLKVDFFTFIEKELEAYLNSYSDLYKGLTNHFDLINTTPLFYYDYPLINSRIFPRLDTIVKSENHLDVNAENILMYGFIEGTAKVVGNKVVYDPQSPINPQSFILSGSQATELVIILNWTEAVVWAKSEVLDDIKNYFFIVEKADYVILKMGAMGACIFSKENESTNITVYRTDNVWSIGSGDVFAATFSYNWFLGINVIEAAKKASYATAEYCNCGDYQFHEFESNPNIIPLNITERPKGQIYLAGPFFTFSQRWLIDRIRRDLMEMGLNVFSPLHDVGYGIGKEIAIKDIEALKKSSLVFAVLDGMDSGTLFETGYAAAKEIPIIGYVQNESENSLTMLKGCKCEFVKDLSTAIYKAYWTLADNE
ncbi:MAG: Nucleoside 2-deoxyribosyltransferase [Sphingobacteriales bacterium]|nr:Nucleoside 2-deoxyribosyltransferase [Sphingobacteriales bacterium]